MQDLKCSQNERLYLQLFTRSKFQVTLHGYFKAQNAKLPNFLSRTITIEKQKMRTGFLRACPGLLLKKRLKNKSVVYNTALCIRANEVSAKVPLSKKKLRAGGGNFLFCRDLHTHACHHTGRQAPIEKALKFFKMLVGFEVVYRMMVQV